MELLLMIIELTVFIFSLYFFYYLMRNIKFSFTKIVIIIYQLIAVILIFRYIDINGFHLIDLFLEIFAYVIVISRLYIGVYKVDLKHHNLLETVNEQQINYIVLSSLDELNENSSNDLIKVLKEIDSNFIVNKKLKTLGKINLSDCNNCIIIKIMIWGDENKPFPIEFNDNMDVTINSYKNGYEYIIKHKF